MIKDFRTFVNENLADKLNANELNEASLNRVWKHSTDPNKGMIIIASDRASYDDKTRLAKQKELEKDIRNFKNSSGKEVGFNKVKGGFIENLGTEDEVTVEETSYIVFFDKEYEDEFFEYFVKLCKKYDQDSFLFVVGGDAKYINKQGGVEFKLGAFAPKQLDVYFTKLKNGRKFSFAAATVE